MNIQHLPVLLQLVVTAMIIAVAITHVAATVLMVVLTAVHPHPIIADADVMVAFRCQTVPDAAPSSGFFCFSPAAVITKHSIITTIIADVKALSGFFFSFACAVTEKASAKNITQSFFIM